LGKNRSHSFVEINLFGIITKLPRSVALKLVSIRLGDQNHKTTLIFLNFPKEKK